MSYIEERIRDHFIQSILPPALNQTPCDYRINRDDFTAMVQRLGAKVERDPRLTVPDEAGAPFVTLHIAGGSTRVYAAADDTPFGEFRESPHARDARSSFPPAPLGLENPIGVTPSAPKLVVGDVVRLKTGGDWMTVESLLGERADCAWFQRIGTSWSSYVSRDRFPTACLEKRAEPTPPAPATSDLT